MRQVHVVILTAITLEYQAAKRVDARALEVATQLEEREQVFHEAAARFAKGRGKMYERRDRVPLRASLGRKWNLSPTHHVSLG